MIKNIVLDIGNVLVHFRWHELMAELGFSNAEIQHLKENMIYSKEWSEWDRGVISEEQVIHLFINRNIDLKEKIQAFFEHKEELVKQFTYTQEWIMHLKEAGYKIYLLSNYPKEIFKLHGEKVFTFLNLVDGRVVSADVKMVKPNPQIYEYLIEKYDLNRQECVFIDDNVHNVEAAQALGITSILFETYEQTVDKLKIILQK